MRSLLLMASPDLSTPLSLRLTPAQWLLIEQLAQRDAVTAEEAVVRAVEQALSGTVEQALSGTVETGPYPQGTPFYGLEGLLAGLGAGPTDLSTNRAYLDDFGT